MPSEQPPPHNPSSTRQGPPEKLQHPPSRGGVRMLLGLPFSDSGVLSTVALTAPSGATSLRTVAVASGEENDESFGETAPDEGVIEETRGAVADFPERLARSLPYETDTPRDFPRAPRRDGAPFSRAMRENAADARSTLTQPSAEQREQTRLVIPGVSTHRTAFPALSQTADTPTISVEGHAGRNPATGRVTQRSGLPSSRARDDNLRRRVADQTRTPRHRRRESAEGFGGAVQVVSAALAWPS